DPHLALGDRPAADRDLGARDACGALYWTVVAQEFLHGARDQPGRLAKPTQLLGVTQERQRAVADQIDRRLVAGDEREDAGGDQLVLAQLVSRLLSGDQRREQVAARRGAALGDEPSHVVSDGVTGRPAPLRNLGLRRQPDGIEPAGDVEAPALEPLVILDG